MQKDAQEGAKLLYGATASNVLMVVNAMVTMAKKAVECDKPIRSIKNGEAEEVYHCWGINNSEIPLFYTDRRGARVQNKGIDFIDDTYY